MSAPGRQRIKRGAGRVLLALLVLSAGAGVLWYQRLERGDHSEPPAPLQGGEGAQAEMVTRDFRHVETRMDRTVWVLEAERAEIQGETARLRAVKITWYGEPGQVPVVVTSQSGRMDFASRNAVLVGAVRLERADGAVLETERLSWNEQYKLLQAPLPVTITTPTFTFRGQSLVANLAQQWVKLNGQVQGEIRGAGPAAFSPS